MENEFYEFALEQFQFVRAHAVREKDGELYLLAQNFFYEKIYPKNWCGTLCKNNGEKTGTNSEGVTGIQEEWGAVCLWPGDQSGDVMAPLRSVPAAWTISSRLVGRSFSPTSLHFHNCCNSWSVLDPGISFSQIQRNVLIGSVLFGCIWLYFNSLESLSFVSTDRSHGEMRSCLTTATNLNRLLTSLLYHWAWIWHWRFFWNKKHATVDCLWGQVCTFHATLTF